MLGRKINGVEGFQRYVGKTFPKRFLLLAASHVVARRAHAEDKRPESRSAGVVSQALAPTVSAKGAHVVRAAACWYRGRDAHPPQKGALHYKGRRPWRS
jgi:hypothetical protein